MTHQQNVLQFPVTIAQGFHPFSSQTWKVSPTAPMVLQGTPCGRVGHRRSFFQHPHLILRMGVFSSHKKKIKIISLTLDTHTHTLLCHDEAAKSRISENLTPYKVEMHHQLPLYLVVQISEKYFLPDRHIISNKIPKQLVMGRFLRNC